MINLIRYLKDKGRVALRHVPGKGDRECIVLVPRTVIRPGLSLETFVSVEDFQSRFPTPAALKASPSDGGYFDLVRELEKDGML